MSVERKPHKHAELIKAWADGAVIQAQVCDGHGEWVDSDHPAWSGKTKYRIKPAEPREFWILDYQGSGSRYAYPIDSPVPEPGPHSSYIKVREVLE